MSRVLIVYAQDDLQCTKIATHLAELASQFRHDVMLRAVRDVEKALPVHLFDQAIVVAAIHSGKHERSIRRWVTTHVDELHATTGIFISVSLTARDDSPDAARMLGRYIEEFEVETGWRPDGVAYFAGALPYTTYGFLKKRVRQALLGGEADTSHDYEYTDWDAVDRFGLDLFSDRPIIIVDLAETPASTR